MDDGIELNFAAPSSGGASGPKAKIAAPKGGRWTDRAKARRDIRKTVRPTTAPRTEQPAQIARTPAPARPVEHVGQSRPARPLGGSAAAARPSRPAPQAGTRPAAAVSSPSRPAPLRDDLEESPIAGPSRPRQLPQVHSAPKAKPSAGPQIISSLFSYNPAISAPIPTVPTAITATGAPSNAPLRDTSTFEGLGLDKLLVRHLKGKMAVQAPTGVQRSALPYMLASPLDLNLASAPMADDEEDGYEAKPALPIATAPRDVFIQSQTGSGKTLTYLLPIIQTLLPLSRLSYIDRSIGTLAIILAPTRELAQQISKVLEQLLSLALASNDDDDEDSAPMTRWLVSGLLTGGSTKAHEKAKLRKGVPILVATPGRLLDHLQNTTAFKFAKTMFLVLDEADRVMDLGFEETIKGIIRALDGRRRAEIGGEGEAEAGRMRWGYWSRGRQTVLCSATVDAKVEKLAGVALKDPITFRAEPDAGAVKAEEGVKKEKHDPAVQAALDTANSVVLPAASEKFTPPSQLSQKYIVVPTKLRLVTLIALIRSLVAKKDTDIGNKVIVFMSSTDAVDFHWKLLGGMSMSQEAEQGEDAEFDGAESAEDSEDELADGLKPKPKPAKTKAKAKKAAAAEDPITLTSALFPSATLNRLHGSLPLRTRLASLAAFAAASPSPSILICTSVASRGLDLPLVRSVVQYDLPTEGGANEYVHRVGRTARAGKGGEAWAFVSPTEAEWVPWVQGKMGSAEGKEVGLGPVGVEDVLKKGFGGKAYEFERRATEVQGGLERWVLSDDSNATLARKAFASFVRAYSTHPLEEKKFFHTKSLHLGHLAKAFALREAPSAMASFAPSSKHPKAAPSSVHVPSNKKRKRAGAGPGSGDDDDDDDDGAEPAKKGGKEQTARNETERRMYEAVRKQGREVRSGGKMGQFGASAGKGKGKGGAGAGAGGGGGEFQVMRPGELERMLAGKM